MFIFDSLTEAGLTQICCKLADPCTFSYRVDTFTSQIIRTVVDLIFSLCSHQQNVRVVEEREVDGSIILTLLVCLVFSTIFGSSSIAAFAGIVLRPTITVDRTGLCFAIVEGLISILLSRFISFSFHKFMTVYRSIFSR